MSLKLAFSRPDGDPALPRRAVLLRYATSGRDGFPAKYWADEEACRIRIDQQGHAALKTLFEHFGVTRLDPSAADFETVLHTWSALVGGVGMHLRAKALFRKTVYDVLYPVWHPAYQTYLEALWSTEQRAINAAARALGIARGVHEDRPLLRDGPYRRKRGVTKGGV